MDKIRSYRFGKKEKLCNVNDIAELFKGEYIFSYPFKVGYNITIKDSEQSLKSVKVLCSVGKRYSKSAVKRNLIKRRIRESYRLNKHILIEQLDDIYIGKEITINMGFVFISKKEESYELLQKQMQKILHKLSDIATKASDSTTTTTD